MQVHEIHSCEQLVNAWDNGELVHTVEMGGLGPGYEQAIHITAFEILRYMLAHPPDWQRIDGDAEHEDMPYELKAWTVYQRKMDEVLFADNGPCKGLGLSGAQFGAACNIACMFLRNGYQEAMKKAPEDRKIMVSKSFPGERKRATA